MICKMHEYKVMRETDISLPYCIHPSALHSEVNPITLIFQWRKEDHTDKTTYSATELVTVARMKSDSRIYGQSTLPSLENLKPL